MTENILLFNTLEERFLMAFDHIFAGTIYIIATNIMFVAIILCSPQIMSDEKMYIVAARMTRKKCCCVF